MPLASEMAHSLSMLCVSPWINLLSLYCGSLLNSFLHEAKNSHLMAILGARLRSGWWPSSPLTPFLSFLQQPHLTHRTVLISSLEVKISRVNSKIKKYWVLFTSEPPGPSCGWLAHHGCLRNVWMMLEDNPHMSGSQPFPLSHSESQPHLFRVLFGITFFPIPPSFPGPWVFLIKTKALPDWLLRSPRILCFSKPRFPLIVSIHSVAPFINFHNPTCS